MALLLVAAGLWTYQFVAGMARPVNILVMGTDRDGTRTDVVMLVRWVPDTAAVRVLSLPRDLWVPVPCPPAVGDCQSPDKLAHVHAYGELPGGPGGPQLLARTVSAFLAVPVDHWVRVDFRAFARAVDALGGVRIDVEQRMYYEDPYQDLRIDLQPGEQVLDGEQALHYVRFRHDELGDIGRVRRTQRFLHALLATAREQGLLARAPALVAAVLPDVETDLDLATAASLARAARHLDPDALASATVPGSPAEVAGLWVWQPDIEATRRLVQEHLLGEPPASDQP